MGSKTILKKTKFGNVLAKRPGESLASLNKRQTKEFEKKIKKLLKKRGIKKRRPTTRRRIRR